MPAPSKDLSERLESTHTRYGGWIRRRLRALFPRDWEDMTQDVMVRVSAGLNGLRDTRDQAVRSWVGRALRSVCVDEIRRRARRPVITAPVDDLSKDDPTALSVAAKREDVERLMGAAWETLSERERHILTLRFRDALSFREIGEVLGVPQGSVAGWYSRALDRLRESLS